MGAKALRKRLTLARWRVQSRIGRALHAVDKLTGSTLERRILCGVLDRLGSDGVVPFLNGDPVEALEREINSHVMCLERRAKESDVR